MKKNFFSFLKVSIPLGLGLFLIWWYYSSLTETDKVEIIVAFKAANYSWILISLVFAVLSHLSRAYRWNYTLEPLGYKTKFWNNFFAVMVAYLVNLAVPRLGEISRCTVINQYEKVPFNKLLGTVIAERVADFIILMGITVAVVFIQFETIGDLIMTSLNALASKFSFGLVMSLASIMVIGGLAVLYLLFWSKSSLPFIIKLREAIKGLLEGVISIFKMKNKWYFLAHTFFIWLMYLLMFYLCFFSLPETKDVPIGGILTAFVLGGFTIVATNGGIGAYPLAIQGVLLLYEVDKNTGGAFGWIVWTAQTILLLILGGLSFILLPIYNKSKEPVHVEA